jgi:archaellum biogenesis ATPase FlaH
MQKHQIDHFINVYKEGRFESAISDLSQINLYSLTKAIDESIKKKSENLEDSTFLDEMWVSIVNERLNRSRKRDKLKKIVRSEDEITDIVFDEDDTEINSSNRLSISTWKDFIGRSYADPKWVVREMIPEKGLVAIAGSPESCKSFFSVYLAVKISQGLPILDKYETTKARVLLIDQESIPSWLQKRFTELSKKDDLPIFIFDNERTHLNLSDDDVFDELLNFIKSNSIGLVIIDTLRMAHSNDENSSTDMKPIVERLKKLTSYCSVLFIHHHRKTDKFNRNKSSGEDMMGSIFIRGALDYQFTLTNLGEQDDGVTKIRVTQTKARYTQHIKSFEMSLEQRDGDLTFIYKGEVEDDKLKKGLAKERVIELLTDSDIQRKELLEQIVAEEICRFRTAEEALKELCEEDKIKHTTKKPHLYSLISSKEEEWVAPSLI